MRKTYENGYQGKIQYWTGQLNAEVMNTKVPDIQVIKKCLSKLEYFTSKQLVLDDNTIAGIDFGDTIELLDKLKITTK